MAHYVLARGPSSLVVAGTHGKTTTSSLLAWILEERRHRSELPVGGLPAGIRRGFRLGRGPWMVIEGDEYNTAFFDRGPKFLHYRPHLFILGPVEFDHADLYPNLDAVLTAFRAGAAQVPKTGAVVVNAWSEHALAATRDATAPVVRVGSEPGCDLVLSSWEPTPAGGCAELRWRGELMKHDRCPSPATTTPRTPPWHWPPRLIVGVPSDRALAALGRFPGVARRMETRGEAAGVTVVDDFAHHPTALGVTIAAARQRWPRHRLVVAFEPRSLTAARRDFGAAYLEALSGADLVLVAAPFHSGRLAEDEILDRDELARELEARGVRSLMPEPGADSVEVLLPHLETGDVVLGCSSGSFDGFHARLLEALGARAEKLTRQGAKHASIASSQPRRRQDTQR